LSGSQSLIGETHYIIQGNLEIANRHDVVGDYAKLWVAAICQLDNNQTVSTK
jgi:hypothetical protein